MLRLLSRTMANTPVPTKVPDINLEMPRDISIELAQRILNVDIEKNSVQDIYTSYRNHRCLNRHDNQSVQRQRSPGRLIRPGSTRRTSRNLFRPYCGSKSTITIGFLVKRRPSSISSRRRGTRSLRSTSTTTTWPRPTSSRIWCATPR